jgi:hypothetical protein
LGEASDTLRELAAQARTIRAQYLTAINAAKASPTNVATTVDAIDFFFDLSGYKRAASRIGRALARNSSQQQLAMIGQQGESWASAVRSALGGFSLVGKQVPAEANSVVLLRRYAGTQKFARLDVRLAHGISLLEGLAEDRVVRNQDLAGLRRKDTTVPGQRGDSLSVEVAEVIGLLDGLPQEQEALRGGWAVYQNKMPDYGRQALNSLRNALENVTKRLSGEGDWSEGLRKLVPSETRRQMIRQPHTFLSAYGTHAASAPSDADVELGFRLTAAAIRALRGIQRVR